MRILFVTPYYHPELKFGGPPKRLHALARNLFARGHEVQVVTFHSEDRDADQTQVLEGIHVRYLPWRGKVLRQIPTKLTGLREILPQVDVVHCYGLYNLICPLAAFLAKRRQKPFLLEPMGMFIPRNRSFAAKGVYNATATKWMARNAAAVVATSELEAKELKAISSKTELAIRGNGIDLDEFRVLPPRHLMRDHWGTGSTEQLVLYVGRISAKKRLIELIQAFKHTAIPNARLVIAGPVSEQDYLAKIGESIVDLEVGDRVMVTGALYGDNLLAALSAADLFVLPSENENFGNAAGEAVAAGLPVLLTETCGIAPLIHERAGLAVPLGVESITNGLRMMLNPKIRDQMTARREEVKRELSWDEPVTQTIALYERILSEKRRH